MMISLQTLKGGMTALLCGVALFSSTQVGHAQGANWSGYTSWPSNPNGAYDDTKPAHYPDTRTVQDGDALKATIQSKITSGATYYQVPAGVYRFTTTGAIVNVLRVNNFTLDCTNCTFVLANSGAYLLSGYKYQSDTGAGTCSNITIQGSDTQPLVIDRETLPPQGKITGYNTTTGVLQIQIMNGYSDQVASPPDSQHPVYVTVYTAQGKDIPYGYYHDNYGSYSNVQINDTAKTVQITTDTNKSSIYAVGNYVTLPMIGGNPPVMAIFERDVANNLTLKNIVNGAGGAALDLWSGGLSGTTQIIRVKNGPPPGTNRLGASPCLASTSTSHDTVVIDGCEFGSSFDDCMDIQGNGFNMYYQTLNPNQIIVWSIYGGQPYTPNDTISIYANGNFANAYTATVTDAVPYTNPNDPGNVAALTAARATWRP